MFITACLLHSYDVNVDEMIEETKVESPEIIQKCTTDNNLDEGCVIECVFLGDGACDEYVEIVQNTATADIPDAPNDTPDDTEGLPDINVSDLEISDNSDTSPTDAGEIPEGNDTPPEDNEEAGPSGSLGDPHCKFQTMIASCRPAFFQMICSHLVSFSYSPHMEERSF